MRVKHFIFFPIIPDSCMYLSLERYSTLCIWCSFNYRDSYLYHDTLLNTMQSLKLVYRPALIPYTWKFSQNVYFALKSSIRIVTD